MVIIAEVSRLHFDCNFSTWFSFINLGRDIFGMFLRLICSERPLSNDRFNWFLQRTIIESHYVSLFVCLVCWLVGCNFERVALCGDTLGSWWDQALTKCLCQVTQKDFYTSMLCYIDLWIHNLRSSLGQMKRRPYQPLWQIHWTNFPVSHWARLENKQGSGANLPLLRSKMPLVPTQNCAQKYRPGAKNFQKLQKMPLVVTSLFPSLHWAHVGSGALIWLSPLCDLLWRNREQVRETSFSLSRNSGHSQVA